MCDKPIDMAIVSTLLVPNVIYPVSLPFPHHNLLFHSSPLVPMFQCSLFSKKVKWERGVKY